MSDVAVIFDPVKWRGDLQLLNGQITMDNTLYTAVFLSLFCERRAEPGDVLPDDDPRNPGQADPRGFWGDWFWGQLLQRLAAVAGVVAMPTFRLGSRLWLLRRSKQLPDVLIRAEAYASEALQWLLDYNIASSVTVKASIPRTGVLGFKVVIKRYAQAANDNFDYVWPLTLGEAA